jgi:phosphatidylglycerophosphate synthase
MGTGLSPNVVTVAGITLGIAGGLLLAVPGMLAVLAAVILLMTSSVLDCSDGELARLCHAESRLGHWLDVIGDTVVHIALLVGIAARLAADGNAPGWPVLGLLLLGVLGAFGSSTACSGRSPPATGTSFPSASPSRDGSTCSSRRPRSALTSSGESPSCSSSAPSGGPT